MKILGAIACIFLLSTICMAEEAEYFDWKGSKLFESQNFTGALTYFDKAVNQDPEYIKAWLHKGNTEKQLQKYNDSIISFNAALKIDKENAAAWSGIAGAFTAIKDYKNASNAAEKATEFSNTKENWLREGNLLQTQEAYQEAVTKYDGALALDPKYKDALYKKGFALMAMVNLSEAEEQFDQALEIDPNFKQAYLAKGIILEAEGKFLDAQKAYDKALVIDPAYGMALVHKMHVLMALKKQDEAMKIFVKM